MIDNHTAVKAHAVKKICALRDAQVKKVRLILEARLVGFQQVNHFTRGKLMILIREGAEFFKQWRSQVRGFNFDGLQQLCPVIGQFSALPFLLLLGLFFSLCDGHPFLLFHHLIDTFVDTWLILPG